MVFGAVVRVGREHALYDFKAVASQKVEQELIPQLEKEINLKKLEMENWKKETVVFRTK